MSTDSNCYQYIEGKCRLKPDSVCLGYFLHGNCITEFCPVSEKERYKPYSVWDKLEEKEDESI